MIARNLIAFNRIQQVQKRQLNFGRRHVNIVSNWTSSAAIYGVTGFITLCYFTEWKEVLRYLPYYNTKYMNKDGVIVDEE